MTRILALACLALSGCTSTDLRDPSSGRLIAHFGSNVYAGDYQAGATHFSFARIDNSTTTRASWAGANKLAGTVASAVVAGLVPGGSTTAVVSKTAISAVPHFAPTPSQP